MKFRATHLFYASTGSPCLGPVPDATRPALPGSDDSPATVCASATHVVTGPSLPARGQVPTPAGSLNGPTVQHVGKVDLQEGSHFAGTRFAASDACSPTRRSGKLCPVLQEASGPPWNRLGERVFSVQTAKDRKQQGEVAGRVLHGRCPAADRTESNWHCRGS